MQPARERRSLWMLSRGTMECCCSQPTAPSGSREEGAVDDRMAKPVSLAKAAQSTFLCEHSSKLHPGHSPDLLRVDSGLNSTVSAPAQVAPRGCLPRRSGDGGTGNPFQAFRTCGLTVWNAFLARSSEVPCLSHVDVIRGATVAAKGGINAGITHNREASRVARSN